MVDFTPIAQAKVFQPIAPFYFGMPEFKVGPIFMMTIFCVINMIQCIGVFSVIDEITGIHTDNKTKERGIRGQAVSQIFTGAFNSVPSTMFNENVSLIDLTKVKSRSVIVAAGIMVVLAGIFPKISAVITAVPKCVLGGATFASEIFVNMPETLSMVMSNGLFMVSASAIILNLLLNGKKALS